MNVKELKSLKKISAFYGEFAIFTTTDSKEGLINRQGEIIYPAEKYDLVFYHCGDVFNFWLNTDGVIKSHMFFDAKLGKEVPEPKLEVTPQPEIPDFANKFEEARWCAYNRISYKDNGLYGIMDEDGKIIVPPTYDQVGLSNPNAKRDRISVKLDGKNGYIDLDGNVIIPFEHPYVGFNKELGLHKFHTKEDKWGYMDKSGRVIIPAVYDAIDARETHGLDEIAVTKDGRCYFINVNQEEVKVF